jgi:hypothetical protein
VSYLTALCDDVYSDRMIAAWKAEGIDTGLVARLPGGCRPLHHPVPVRRANAAFPISAAAAARDC